MKDNQKELFIVVDKNDKVLGYRTRFECHHDKSLIHRAVDVLLVNSKGEYLIQKRSRQKDLFPGYYCVAATGHVSKGEEYEETAVRELSEEMGVTGVTLIREGTFLVYDDRETEMVALFTGRYDGPVSFPADEVESVIYVKKEDMKKLENFTPSSATCLRHLHIL